MGSSRLSTKRRYANLFSSLALFGAASIVACDTGEKLEPISHQSAALTAETNATAVLSKIADSTAFIDDSDAMVETLALLSSCDDEGEESAGQDDTAPPPAPGDPVAVPPDPIAPAPIAGPPNDECGVQKVRKDLAQLRKDLNEGIDELIDVLKNEILIEGNIESQSATEVVYRIPAATICKNNDGLDAPPLMGMVGIDMTDAQCLADAQKAQIRARLTSHNAGEVTIDILATASKHKVVTVDLLTAKIGMSLDLGNLFAAMKELSPEDSDDIVAMSGVVAASLVKNGDKDFSLIGEIKKDVNVETQDPESGNVKVGLKASVKTWELRLNGIARSITAATNWGPLSITAPLVELGGVIDATEKPNAMGPKDVFQMVLGGLNGSLEFNGNTDNLSFKMLGLGDRSSAVSVNGKEIIGLDINKNNGRRFDMTLARGAGDTTQISFAPAMQAEVRFNFSSIQDKFDDLPAFALGDTLSIDISGTTPTITDNDAGLKVVSGQLQMTSTQNAASNVTVAAGMCLVENPEPADGAHKLLGGFKSGACQ